MPNKHQVQKNFYERQKEWKEQFKVKENQSKEVCVLFDEEIYPEFKDSTQLREHLINVGDFER